MCIKGLAVKSVLFVVVLIFEFFPIYISLTN